MSWPELGDIDRIVRIALLEDLAVGDITGRLTIPAEQRALATITAKSDLVFCGGPVVRRVFESVERDAIVTVVPNEGDRVAAGTVVVRIAGTARAVVAAERTALNLLQRCCGVATTTRRFVDAAAGRIRVVDTRKTMPGLRALDRHAVRCGGAVNHRNDLGSGILIKENHVRAAGGIAAAVGAARTGAPHGLRVQCEVRNLGELRQALAAGAHAVLLDNMSDQDIAAAVEVVAGRVPVEVSGGIGLDRLAVLADLGVDIVSVGALTHSAPAADLSLLLEDGVSA